MNDLKLETTTKTINVGQPEPSKKREDGRAWEEEFDNKFVYGKDKWKTEDLGGSPAMIAPSGIKSFISDLLQAEEKRIRREILLFLDELELKQPEDLKEDNWRNWKYIRNSIVDKYKLKEIES